MTPADAVSVLQRIRANRPPPPAGERCEMCAAPLAEEHQHVVSVAARSLLCTCRSCYLLFTDSGADLRYRAVPERYLSFPGFRLAPGRWDDLEIPVGTAFFFTNSALGRTVCFYPGPAGATESELPLDAWAGVVADNPALSVALPDVEALLVRTAAAADGAATCHLVPIDACYELVGRLRRVWRGFDGGQQARAQMADFFARVADRSRPSPAPGSSP